MSAASSPQHFNARGVWTEGWYALVRSEEVRRGHVIQRDRLGFRLAIFRGQDGEVRVLDGRCPHMGASLGEGCVLENAVRCPFHHWTFAGDGSCASVPYRERPPEGARTRGFVVEERYGLVFVYFGDEPSFALPELPAGRSVSRFRKGLVPSHPHVMVPTAVDRWHWQCVHGIEVEDMSEPVIVGPFEIRNQLRGALTRSPTTWPQRILRVLGHRDFDWTWTAYGSNMFVASLRRPFVMDFLIAYLPLEEAASEAETVFAFPKRSLLARWSGVAWVGDLWRKLLLGLLFYDDIKIVRSMRFWPRLTKEDSMVGRWIAHVRRMPVGPQPASHALDEGRASEAPAAPSSPSG